MQVLVGDAESEYAEVMRELLRRQSHRVVLAASFDSCRRFLDRSQTDLVVVSSSIGEHPLPTLVRELVDLQTAPIMALLDSDSPAELSACFTAGATDCVRKPFHASEFVARIDAMERLIHLNTGSTDTDLPARGQSALSQSHFGDFTFDHKHEQVLFQGQNVNCTQLEYQILTTLGATDGEVVSHVFLNERIWGYSNLTDGTLLKGHISSIRRKLAAAGAERDPIRTIYGVGYVLST